MLRCHHLYCHGTCYFSAGQCVCNEGYLSVQYYGKERVLQIKSIAPLDPADTSNLTPIKEKLSEKFSTLSLTSDPQNTKPLSAHSSPNTSVYKITAKTKIIIESKENSSNSSSSKVISHSVCADSELFCIIGKKFAKIVQFCWSSETSAAAQGVSPVSSTTPRELSMCARQYSRVLVLNLEVYNLASNMYLYNLKF